MALKMTDNCGTDRKLDLVAEWVGQSVLRAIPGKKTMECEVSHGIIGGDN